MANTAGQWHALVGCAMANTAGQWHALSGSAIIFFSAQKPPQAVAKEAHHKWSASTQFRTPHAGQRINTAAGPLAATGLQEACQSTFTCVFEPG